MMTVYQMLIIRIWSQSILIGIHSGGWKLKKRDWKLKRIVLRSYLDQYKHFEIWQSYRHSNNVTPSKQNKENYYDIYGTSGTFDTEGSWWFGDSYSTDNSWEYYGFASSKGSRRDEFRIRVSWTQIKSIEPR